eukprot:967830_1
MRSIASTRGGFHINSQSNNRSNSNNSNNNNNNNNDNSAPMTKYNYLKLRSTENIKRLDDGSVTLSVTLDKDHVECCVCLSSMTDTIYRCQGNVKPNDLKVMKPTVCHNICGECAWRMRRMKAENGHTKSMQCPICKVQGTFVRNIALERQLRELSQECVNSAHGCKERFFPWDDRRGLHEKHLCIYGAVDCPFCYQTIAGGRHNFVRHLSASIQPATKEEDDDMDTTNAQTDTTNDDMEESVHMNDREEE